MRLLIYGFCALSLAACQFKAGKDDGADQEAQKEKKSARGSKTSESSEALGFLMSMTWEEARMLSSQSLEVPPFYRVAADKIEVLRTNPDGSARRVRALGRVFIEMHLAEDGRALCQEAFISEDELILRGKPLLQRGSSAVEGLDDVTVFYMLGSRLRVIGRHRIKNESEVIQSALSKRPVENPQNEGVAVARSAPLILPLKSGPWAGGPNPLLPPLSSSSIPEEVRQLMRTEADSVKVIPLRIPGEEAVKPAVEPAGAAAPPSGNEPDITPPATVKEEALLLPVPDKSER